MKTAADLLVIDDNPADVSLVREALAEANIAAGSPASGTVLRPWLFYTRETSM